MGYQTTLPFPIYMCFSGISADGVYQAKGFQGTINSDNESLFVKQVSWDASHWLNLAVTDVRDGNIWSSSDFFSKFIERTNTVGKFCALILKTPLQ